MDFGAPMKEDQFIPPFRPQNFQFVVSPAHVNKNDSR